MEIKSLIEYPPVVSDTDTTISKIIGILKERNAYDIFIHLVGTAVIGINIRDILSVRDISATKPSIVGKRIPTLTLRDNIGHAARLMSLYRLRALPVIESHHGEIVGQISAKGIIKAMIDSNVVGSGKAVKKSNVTIAAMENTGRKSIGIEGKPTRLDLKISGIIDTDNLSVSEVDDSLRSVIDLMLKINSTYTIVKSFDEIQGIITYRDVIELLGERVEEEEIPTFIVGLPDDPFDAELSKSKFTNLVRLLRRAYPEIEEARCHMKLRDIQGERKRYEVAVNFVTPHRRHTYKYGMGSR